MRQAEKTLHSPPQARQKNQDLIRPLPFVSREVMGLNNHREIVITAALLLLTLAASVLFFLDVSEVLWNRIRQGDFLDTIEQILFFLIIFFLVYGNVLYQLTRWGYFQRIADHRPARLEELERLFDGVAPSLTVLIPSYKEDVDVVKRTLLSAALQYYPNKRVVLLIDDPPNPTSPEDRKGVEAMRALPGEIRHILDEIRRPLQQAYDFYLERHRTGSIDPYHEGEALAQVYQEVALWFSRLATEATLADHGEKLLIEKVLRDSARAHQRQAQALQEKTSEESLSEAEILHHYRKLAALFQVHVSSFERKKYINLSHEANKAMNLNSYIGLIGGFFREIRRNDGLHLEPMVGLGADLIVPPTDFLIMLDADSLVTPDYAIRLIHHMIQPGNKRVAVAQTPYSTIPDAPGILERVAGATTDIQYIIHQGFTAYNATYWVGANALIRKAALDDIAQAEYERGFPIIRYIQDRTVIEDTESSVDLAARGWTLYNYPQRLAYSATPPDFGSLLIQRRRWANGGLLIIPKLLGYLWRGPDQFFKVREGFFRFHYLFSIAAVNFGLLLLLAFPFEGNTRSVWLPLTALPYFYLYARDLVQIGYRWTDMFRVYALNLMLLPVNLAGVLSSIRQGIMGHKVPFGRTPKVVNRTAVPALYLLAEYTLAVLWFLAFARDIYHGFWNHAVFSLITLGFLSYAIVRFIGLKESMEDLALAYIGWTSRPHPAKLRESLTHLNYTLVSPFGRRLHKGLTRGKQRPYNQAGGDGKASRTGIHL